MIESNRYDDTIISDLIAERCDLCVSRTAKRIAEVWQTETDSLGKRESLRVTEGKRCERIDKRREAGGNVRRAEINGRGDRAKGILVCSEGRARYPRR